MTEGNCQTHFPVLSFVNLLLLSVNLITTTSYLHYNWIISPNSGVATCN